MPQVRTLLLGAGASRGVSYAGHRKIKSPLDRDFFEWLKRFDPADDDKEAVRYVINKVLEFKGPRLWDSLEKAFYTLHIRAQMDALILTDVVLGDEQLDVLLQNFTRSINALLRAAHGQQSCEYHVTLFRKMSSQDAILTFNYDLVPERSIMKLNPPPFGPWLYGFARRPKSAGKIPQLTKLHGSVNWRTGQNGSPTVNQTSWGDFLESPGYRAKGSSFSIMLPYWDKKIENAPWRNIWRSTAEHLQKTTHLLIWGYSLPLTDLKARALIDLCLRNQDHGALRVCVVDHSEEVLDRWHDLFAGCEFWPFRDIKEFFGSKMGWW